MQYPLPCSVGDALCTIAACTSFPEPFVIPPGQKRLSFSHKKFAGHRASDHIAMLNAFYQWEKARSDVLNKQARSFTADELFIHSG